MCQPPHRPSGSGEAASPRREESCVKASSARRRGDQRAPIRIPPAWSSAIKAARAHLRRRTLLVVAGLPGAGKSAFLRELGRSFAVSRRHVRLLAAQAYVRQARVGEAASRTGTARDLEAEAAVLLLDDADALAEAELARVWDAASRLRRGRVVLGTAERLEIPEGLSRQARTLRVPPLDEPTSAAVLADASSLVSPSPRQEVLDEAARLCCGHPGALGRVGEMLARGAHAKADAIADAADAALCDVLRRLDANAERLLDAAALYRIPVPVAGLAAIAGEAAVEAALGSLLGRFLLEPVACGSATAEDLPPSPAEARYRCAGVVATAWKLRRRPVEDRQRDHRAAAAFCRSLAGDADACLEAHRHLLAAGEPEEARQVAAPCVDRLTQTGRAPEAISLIERTQRALPEPDALLAVTAVELLLSLYRLEDAERQLAEAMRLVAGARCAPPSVHGMLLLAEATIRAARCPDEEARAVAQAALVSFEQRGDTLRAAQALRLIGHADLAAGRADAAAAPCERALELAAAAHSGQHIADAAYTLALALARAGEHARATELLEQSLELHGKEGRRDRACVVLHALLSVRREAGRSSVAIDDDLVAFAAVHGAGTLAARASLSHDLARSLLQCGRYREAIGHFEEARRLYAACGAAEQVLAADALIAACRGLQGESDFDELARIAEGFERLGRPEGARSAELATSFLLSQEGRHEEAIVLGERCFEHYRRRGDAFQVVAREATYASLLATGRFALTVERCAEVLELCSGEASSRRGGVRKARSRCMATAHAALAEVRRGRAERAGELIEGAIAERCAPDDQRLCTVLCHRILEEVEGARGQPGRAERARRVWREALLAAHRELQDRLLIELEMRGLGLPVEYVRTTGTVAEAADLRTVLETTRSASEFDLLVDGPSRRVFRSGAGAGWTDMRDAQKQLDLLVFLVSRAGVPVTTEALFRAVWGQPRYDEQAKRTVVHSAVYRLRRMLGARKGRSPIASSPGGYSFRWPRTATYCLISLQRRLRRLNLPARQRALVEYLEWAGEEARTAPACARYAGVSRTTVLRDLHTLAEARLVLRIGRGPATRYALA